MAGSYKPQSPDLSSLHSNSLSGYRPQSPDLTALSAPVFDNSNPFQQQYHRQIFPAQNHPQYPPHTYQTQATSAPFAQAQPFSQQHQQLYDMRMKQEDAYMTGMQDSKAAMQSETKDPTLGVALKTSFPVARIKRIMQADEDIGKVAQVTPHVVSRALELFMIKLITSSSDQARGPAGANNKGPKRILVQHMKRAIQSDDTFDFLADIVAKVPDAPSKSKKEANSDSEDAKPKKRAKKRKDDDD